MRLAFEIKMSTRESGLFQKVMTYKLCQNANFKKWGYHYSNGHPECTAEHVVNIFNLLGT